MMQQPDMIAAMQGGNVAYGSIDESKKIHPDIPTLCRTVALTFTVACFCGFGAPIILSVQMGMDPDVGYWIGRYGLFAALMPIFFIAQHFAHLYFIEKRRLNRKFLLAVVLFPGAFFCIVGGCYMSEASFYYESLKSEDCSGGGLIPEKAKLQEDYDQAEAMYSRCKQAFLEENNNVPLTRHVTLPMCEEYQQVFHEADSRAGSDKGLKPWHGYPLKGQESLLPKMPTSAEFMRQHRSGWNYLATVETNHMCGGFCERGPMLWADMSIPEKHMSSCAPFIALKFQVIAFQGEMLLFVNLGICLCALLIFHGAKNSMSQLGYY